MATLVAVDGAKITCSGAIGPVISTVEGTCDVEATGCNGSILTESDKEAITNIVPFVSLCKFRPFPFFFMPLTHLPCQPIINDEWEKTTEEFGDINESILTQNSCINCAWGGEINIFDTNQYTITAEDEILKRFQVEDDLYVMWQANLTGGTPFLPDWREGPEVRMTETEARLLDQLTRNQGINGLRKFRNIASNDPQNLGKAYTVAIDYFPIIDSNGNEIRGGEDGHNDAFRHTYLNALLTKEFGPEFADSFSTAHEGPVGNPADKEAMDLYNNELGRRIATENPDASEEELAQLVFDAVNDGEAVVIDSSGNLVFSDDESVGNTGSADDPPANGNIAPEEWSESN